MQHGQFSCLSLGGFSEHRIGEEALTHKVREALKVGADPSTESYTERKPISTLSFLPWFEWEMPAHRPMCLNDCSPVGGVIWGVSDPLGGWALLEEVLGAAFWSLEFKTLSTPVHSLCLLPWLAMRSLLLQPPAPALGLMPCLPCSAPAPCHASLLQALPHAMPPCHQGLSWYCKPE